MGGDVDGSRPRTGPSCPGRTLGITLVRFGGPAGQTIAAAGASGEWAEGPNDCGTMKRP
jgi:hypothetical protein